MGCDCRRNLKGEVIEERKYGVGGRVKNGVLQFLFKLAVVAGAVVMVPAVVLSLVVSLFTKGGLTVFVPSRIIGILEKNGKQQELQD